jgi:hypothetical protein
MFKIFTNLAEAKFMNETLRLPTATVCERRLTRWSPKFFLQFRPTHASRPGSSFALSVTHAAVYVTNRQKTGGKNSFLHLFLFFAFALSKKRLANILVQSKPTPVFPTPAQQSE